jgi:hypothetical protein
MANHNLGTANHNLGTASPSQDTVSPSLDQTRVTTSPKATVAHLPHRSVRSRPGT